MRDDKVSDVPRSTYPPPRVRECSRDYNSSSYLSLSFIHPIFLTATVVDTVCHFCLCIFFSFDGEREPSSAEKEFFCLVPYPPLKRETATRITTTKKAVLPPFQLW